MTPDQLTAYALIGTFYFHVLYVATDNAIAAVQWVRNRD